MLYLDFERPADLRTFADADAFLRSQTGRLIVPGEVHLLPDLFAQLRGATDERRKAGGRTGQFLLLGSASLDLIQRAKATVRLSYRLRRSRHCQTLARRPCESGLSDRNGVEVMPLAEAAERLDVETGR